MRSVLCSFNCYQLITGVQVWAQLEQYRSSVGPVKLLYWVYSCKKLDPPVANTEDPHMFDLLGWSEHGIRMVQAFLKDSF